MDENDSNIPMPTRPKKLSDPGKKPARVWELYNEAAETRDKELLKDWDYNINSLLLFAAIFASVLTSLCVESQQLLQQDPLDLIQQTVAFLAARELNASTPLPPVTPFEPDPWAVAVNGYFFASLTASILAAVGAVMCQQWVGEYDAGLDVASTPEQRALRSHYRYRSTKQWYMHQIIAALPILLYISVALFFIGLAVWFNHIYPSLALVPLVGLLIGITGYLVTTFFAVFFPSAPYRTSLSRLLFRIIWLSRFYIWFTIHSALILWRPWMAFTRSLIMDFTKSTGGKMRNMWANEYHFQDAITKYTIRYRSNFILEYAQYTRRMKIKRTQAFPWIHPARDHWQSMHARDWERGHVIKDRTLHLSALAWLANSIHLSPHSKPKFELLLTELNIMDEKHFYEWSAYKYDAPWGHIFQIVLSPSETISPRMSNNKLVLDDIEVHSIEFSGDAKPAASTVISTNQNIAILSTVAQLLGKMADHPDLFERTISRTSDALIIEFMVELSKYRPTNKKQASNRLRSITSLFSSKRWQRMDASLQPIYLAFKAILDCLRVGNIAEDEKSITWIFTLCSAVTGDDRVPWPDPEFVGVISYALKHEALKRRAIRYYIEYTDALLTKSALPLTDSRTWRWRIPTVEPDGISQTPVLEILAEYLLKGLAATENALNRSKISEVLRKTCQNTKSIALRSIIEGYQFRSLETANLPGSSVALHTYIHDQEKQPVELVPCDEPTLYAAMFCLGLRGYVPLRLALLQSSKVMLAAFEANMPTLDTMLYEWIIGNIERITCEDWIAILRALYKRKAIQELECYNEKMIEKIPFTWMSVFTQVFKDTSIKEDRKIIKHLLITLHSYLPDRLAWKRWQLVTEHVSRSNGHITVLRRVVDRILSKSTPPKMGKLETVASPLPGILEKILTELAGVHSSRESELVVPYIHIIDEITRGYLEKKSWDELFLLEFRCIASEISRIRKFSVRLDDTQFPDGEILLRGLLDRIEGFKDQHDAPYDAKPELSFALDLQYLPHLQEYASVVNKERL